MRILAEAPDDLMVGGDQTVEGVVEKDIHRIQHDDQAPGWQLRQERFQALHFHRKAERLRERCQVQQMPALVAAGARELELPTIGDSIRHGEVEEGRRVMDFKIYIVTKFSGWDTGLFQLYGWH